MTTELGYQAHTSSAADRENDGVPLPLEPCLDARDAAPLPAWLDQLAASGLSALASLANTIREDQQAVVQGITTPYNLGVNEGRITDLKLQKRIMAGRAGVPLLRHRVVLMAPLRRHYP
ncbi:hypothetical protein [Streptomyces doebereineriae]|uniref:Transposase n=1 Tax=Streptomyces doebereineriae TaxID=3075528 RepID=A0ABU2VD04_9ACTN|nr:hypothetical protein [Streptomyces sp. DSM 41640]MDT0483031.1 hypothetical protein [Streptomyces sp. DSM 41640]